MIILEYLDESLIVLRRKLCWDLIDILSLPLHILTYSYKDFALNSSLIQTLKNWNAVDYKLYETFNATLWKTISSYSSDFEEEKAFYQTQTRKLCTFCLSIFQHFMHGNFEHFLNITDFLVIPKSPWGKEFKIDYTWCILSNTHAMVLKNILRIKEHPEICNILCKSTVLPLQHFKVLKEKSCIEMNVAYCKGNRISMFHGANITRELLEAIKKQYMMFRLTC